MVNPLIAYLQLFHAIDQHEQELISTWFETQTFKEGDYLFKGGKVCDRLFFVYDGVLRIVMVNEKGIELTHFFVKENQFCTILHSFDNQLVANESIQAACDAQVFAISKRKLLELYTLIPYLKSLIDRITQERLLEKIRVRNLYLGEDSANRYKLFVEQQPDVARRVALKDIASYLGITPQSLSRIRRNM